MLRMQRELNRTDTVLLQCISKLRKYEAVQLKGGVKETQCYDRAVHNCKNIRLRK